MIKMWSALILNFSGLLGLLFIFGCGHHPPSTDQVFNYNESNGISSLDPAFARNLENMWVCNQLFDGLVCLDSSMMVVPSVAKSWSTSEDGLVYRFILRDDVFFHPDTLIGEIKGRRVTASDFVFSFRRVMDADQGSPGQWVFSQLDQSKEGGIKALGSDTLEIFLKQPYPPFLGMLTMQYCNVVSPEAVERYGPDFRSHPIGSGPFRYAFWIEDVALVLHKNKDYWLRDAFGEALPYLDAVKISFVKDPSAVFLGLLKGQYDFMSGIHPAYKDELLTPLGELNPAYASQIRFQRTPFIKTDYIGMLVDDDITLSSQSALHDKRVRQALNFAVDREEMVRFLRNNSVYPADVGFIPRGLPAFDAEARYGYRYDVNKAKALLEEAGYPNGQGVEKITLSTTADYVDICAFLQHQWAKIGLQVEVDILPGSAHREAVSNSKKLMFRKSWLADYADAENFLGLFYSPNFCPAGPNYTHFSMPLFDSLFQAAYLENDFWKRQGLYRTMDSLLMDEAPVVPLFYDQVSHFVSGGISGLQTQPTNMLDLSTVRKSKAKL